MTDRRIRVTARAVVRRGDELLVARERDPSEADRFYVPVGGGVEFGERSEGALRREFREELGVELRNVSYLETYESVFGFDGETRHELWRVYEADIAAARSYEADEFAGYESDGEEFACVWKSLAAFRDGDETLYPEKLVRDL